MIKCQIYQQYEVVYTNEFILRSEKATTGTSAKFISVLTCLWVIYDGVKKDMILEAEIIHVDCKTCRH